MNDKVHGDGKKYPRMQIKRELCHCGSPKCVGTQQPFVVRKVQTRDALGIVMFRARLFDDACSFVGSVLHTTTPSTAPPAIWAGGGV